MGFTAVSSVFSFRLIAGSMDTVVMQMLFIVLTYTISVKDVQIIKHVLDWLQIVWKFDKCVWCRFGKTRKAHKKDPRWWLFYVRKKYLRKNKIQNSSVIFCLSHNLAMVSLLKSLFSKSLLNHPHATPSPQIGPSRN